MRRWAFSLLAILNVCARAEARETLYLREVETCEPSTVAVRLGSESGRRERRAFKIDGATLRRVQFTDERTGNTMDLVVDATFGDAVLLAPRADPFREQFRELHLDFAIYRGLCDSAEMAAYRARHPMPFVLAHPGPPAAFVWIDPVVVALARD